jgi:hypothetical protein
MPPIGSCSGGRDMRHMLLALVVLAIVIFIAASGGA